MCFIFILNNVINCTDESRTARSVNHYTRNKYIYHMKPNTFLSNIYNTFGHKIFIVLRRTARYVLTFIFVQRQLNMVVEVFQCSITKETTLTVCSAKSRIQIPNIYTLRYAITKITMLLQISDVVLLPLSKRSRFVVIPLLLLSFICSNINFPI